MIEYNNFDVYIRTATENDTVIYPEKFTTDQTETFRWKDRSTYKLGLKQIKRCLGDVLFKYQYYQGKDK